MPYQYGHPGDAKKESTKLNAPAPQETFRPGAQEGPSSLNQLEEQLRTERMKAEQQAKMVAENCQTMNAIMKIYNEMWAEMRKSQAQRFQIMSEASAVVSEIFFNLHLSRQRTSEAHNKAYLAYLIDAAKD